MEKIVKEDCWIPNPEDIWDKSRWRSENEY